MWRVLWQRAMIKMACSERMKTAVQGARSTSKLATRYVGGPTAVSAAHEAKLLVAAGIRSSLFYLGEYVTSAELVDENRRNKLAAVKTLQQAGLDIHISVDPTQIGQSIDPQLAAANALEIATAIRDAIGVQPGVHCLMLDMEDSSVTTATIALHDMLHDRGLPVALTLQAYLKRTATDMAAQIARGAKVRLVHGAFAAGPDIAHTNREHAKENYRALARQMLSADAKRSGFYPIFATHDERLHRDIVAIAKANGWSSDQYEFEMLYGARPDVAARLSKEGYRVRLYLPFGVDWWPYAMRRIGENPRNAMLLIKGVLFGR